MSPYLTLPHFTFLSGDVGTKQSNAKILNLQDRWIIYQAVLRGALRQQTAFTLVLLAMERFTMVYDDHDADNHHHSYGDDDDNDRYDAGTSDK